jgi:hypothetical protein
MKAYYHFKNSFENATFKHFKRNYAEKYRLVRKSIHPFLVLKGVTEMSFLVLKRINSEEDQYFVLPNCRSITKLQFGNIEY